jgi:hypothetical protein
VGLRCSIFSFGCCIFLRPVSFVNPMLPVFLDCSMLIYPSLFSNVYLHRGLQFVFSLFTREAWRYSQKPQINGKTVDKKVNNDLQNTTKKTKDWATQAHKKLGIWFDLIWILVFNATFSNITAISWRSVLEEAEVPGENHDHGQATGKLYHFITNDKAGREPTLYWW